MLLVKGLQSITYYFVFMQNISLYSLVISNKTLDCQRYSCDKIGLDYKKEREKYEDDSWSPNSPEACPSTSKDAPHALAH